MNTHDTIDTSGTSDAAAVERSGAFDVTGSEPGDTSDAPHLDTLGTSDTLSLTEAANALSISTRTVRRWIDAGKLTAHTGRGRGGVELRITRASVQACKMMLPPPITSGAPGTSDADGLATSDGSPPPTSGRSDVPPPIAPGSSDVSLTATIGTSGASDAKGEPDGGATLREMHARWEGAQLAARLHAARHNEERERRREVEAAAREEQKQLGAEVEFLRRQLEVSRQAEAELRVLLGHQAAALRQLTERPAIAATIEGEAAPAAPEEGTRRRPWWVLWRRG